MTSEQANVGNSQCTRAVSCPRLCRRRLLNENLVQDASEQIPVGAAVTIASGYL